jgi:pimeloyl-ACP methyl ester carboxylesterase
LTESYQEVGRQERPVLILWGKHDKVIPFANSAAVLEVLPQAKLHPIDAGHVPLQEERHEECNELIVSFLKGGPSEGL